MKIVRGPEKQPVFVYGRTGVIVAVHRIAEEGYSKEEAFAEMTGGGNVFDFLWTVHVDYTEPGC